MTDTAPTTLATRAWTPPWTATCSGERRRPTARPAEPTARPSRLRRDPRDPPPARHRPVTRVAGPARRLDVRDAASSPPAASAAASEAPTATGRSTTPISFTGPVDPEPTELGAYYGKRVAWAVVPRRRDLRLRRPSRCRSTTASRTGATTTIALRRLAGLRAGPPHRVAVHQPRRSGRLGHRLREGRAVLLRRRRARALRRRRLRPAGDGRVRSRPMLHRRRPRRDVCRRPHPGHRRRTGRRSGEPLQIATGAASPGAAPSRPGWARSSSPATSTSCGQPWATSGSTTTASATAP